MKIKKKLIKNNYNKGRQGHKIKRIIMHTYGGYGTSLYNWFNDPKSKASAHYATLKSGVVEQYVEDKDTAWHAGTIATPKNPNNNYESIGIEHQDDNNPQDSIRTPELYESSAKLVAKLCKEHDIPCVYLDKKNMWGSGISIHNFYASDGRTCPGGLNVQKIIKRANEILNINNNCMEHPEYMRLAELVGRWLPRTRRFYNSTTDDRRIEKWWVDIGEKITRDNLRADFRYDVLVAELNGKLDLLPWLLDEGQKQYKNLFISINRNETKKA